MARAAAGRRGAEAADSAEALHELGVRGRKTGAFLKDTGERDEHGMQPLDDIFSSPNASEDESGSEDMDISTSAGPGPRTVLKNQRNIQYPIPRSRSPLKTSLNSPARRNPLLDRSSSPVRQSGGDNATVTRKLDFSTKAGKKTAAPATANTNGKQKASVNGTSHRLDESEELDDVVGADEDLSLDDMVEASMQMVSSMQSDPAGANSSPLKQPSSAQKKKGRGRPAKSASNPAPKSVRKPTSKPVLKPPKASVREPSEQPSEPEESDEMEVEHDDEMDEQEEEEEEEEEEEAQPVKKSSGRPPKKNQQEEKASSSKPQSRKRSSLQSSHDDDESETQQDEDDEDEDASPRKKQRTIAPAPSKAGRPKKQLASSDKGKAPATDKPPAKPRGRPKKLPNAGASVADAEEDAGEASFMALQRGPPMPKSRGLVSVRQDTEDMITQTRYGRHSFKPVAFWRGEQVIVEEEEQTDMFHKDGFVLSNFKEVRRVPMEVAKAKNASRNKVKSKPKKAVADSEETLEAWEVSPGIVEGEIVLWEPEHEEHPPADDEPVQVTDERVAISAKAVQTSEIRDATFRFAKTLTMPFMGAGVVDLPPGGEKRPKNSRKMHMVFFVHSGKVMVTINEAQFRISAGGMWFVPRGNYYSITNDYDNPSRVFFCQACEISAAQMDATQTSMMA